MGVIRPPRMMIVLCCCLQDELEKTNELEAAEAAAEAKVPDCSH